MRAIMGLMMFIFLFLAFGFVGAIECNTMPMIGAFIGALLCLGLAYVSYKIMERLEEIDEYI